jgi:hypothetical protein
MSRKHTYIFIFLCLFPFLLAMTFRAADNYRFAQHIEKLKKERPQYFPKEPPRRLEELTDYEFTCYKKKQLSAADSSSHQKIKAITDLNQP